MRKFIILDGDAYAVMKQYTDGYITYSRIIERYLTLEQALAMTEDAIPVNNAGSGNIAGLNIGIGKKKRIRRKCPT